MYREEYMFLGVTVSLVVGLLVLLGYAESQDRAEWEAFKSSHECVVVAHMKGSVSNTIGVSSRGSVVSGVTVDGDKTGYLCNDGITYYRSE